MNSERLSSFSLPSPGQAYSASSSSRANSIACSTSTYANSQSPITTASSIGPQTPSPTLSCNAITGSATAVTSYDVMNQAPQEMYYSQHMSAGQPPTPQTVTSGNISHYSPHQPALMPPGPQYQGSGPYSQYGYNANGLTSPPAVAPTASNPLGTQHVLPVPGVVQNQYQNFDTTGQQPPHGMKPRVTATLWEDEGSLCFQVEARGICVARREDNHMINGTKLLNVAGMTRGRRDGILKSEKIRHVVKIGPMHLKGVWIPYERALDFANKEKITELLYPLFVQDIAERRKLDPTTGIRGPAPPGLPSIGQHHPMSLPGPSTQLPSHSIGRPSLDRANTFPTPPASASSVMGTMGASESFNWQGQGINGTQNTNPITMDAGLSNARSMPTTPATTPPGNSLQSMQNYGPNNTPYDNSRAMYNTQSQQSPYQASTTVNQDRMYAQHSSYQKNDMAPPASRPAPSDHADDQQDSKPNGMIQSDQSAQQHPGDDEGEHEHDAEYTHDSGGAYDSSRNHYNYTAPGVGALIADAHLADMTGSPNHPTPGRATPRTTAPAQSYYQHPGYTSPRVQQPTGNLYTNDRGAPNGASSSDVYATPDMTALSNGYASQPPNMNGAGGGSKRGREDDDELSRPSTNRSAPMGGLDLKRRKTFMETTATAPTYEVVARPASAVGPPRRQ